MNNINENSLLQEIEEDLQRQRIEALWKKYGNTIMGMAAAIVLGTALASGWQHYKTSKEHEATSSYIQIVENANLKQEDMPGVLEAYSKSHDNVPMAAFALLHAAALAGKEGNTDKAVELYESLASNSKLEPLFRELGTLLSVQTQLDKADPKALDAKLNPLADGEGSTWRFAARELQAHLAIKTGDKARAKTLFEALKTAKETPQGIARRSAEMLQWLDSGA